MAFFVDKRDRRDLSVLALLALSWALVAAPLLHTFEHAAGHHHHHHDDADADDAAPLTHGHGSAEHLRVVAVQSPRLVAPMLVAVALPRSERLIPLPPALEARRRTEEPQGP